MASLSGNDFERPVRQLADGFTALRNEYKALAEQHSNLRQSLELTTKECDALRRLLPTDVARPQSTAKLAQPISTQKRNLDEWLTAMSIHSTAILSDSHSQIKDAELAYFKIQDILRTPTAVVKPRASRSASSRSLQPIIEQKRAEQAGQMELDFTLPGSQGMLACPFAANPTPWTSRSHSEVGGLGRRSKRASFHDPLSDAAKSRIGGSSVVSIESASGPACPIRFLDQHSPEDIAKYFEEHKHELPRSHEVCVKRFQSNAESIKQLDAKYGNLVNMIQGLGQKHQPMLPEAPEPDEDMNDEDKQSHRNIENWAKTVGEDVSGEETPDFIAAAEPEADGPNNEERVQRFDRPMKEIRVGESPSRPWGVPIPARYLDRNISFADSIARAPIDAAAVPAPDPAPAAPKPDESMMVLTESADEVTKTSGREADTPAERPKGKCPFDHAALRAKPPIETTAKLPQVSETKHVNIPDFVSAPPPQPRNATPNDEPPLSNEESALTIINHGIAVVENPKSFQGHRFVNHGTLIMGYGHENLQHTLGQILKHGGLS